MKNGRLLFVILLSLMMIAGSNSIPSNSEFEGDELNGTRGETLFNNTVWWINKSIGPQLQSPMSIFINGENKGTTYLLEFGHRNGDAWPEIAAIYNTGYVRLAPSSQPFGTSFVLGPAYWDDNGEYVHTIQISRIDIDTSSATPTGPLHITIHARDYSVSRWPNYRLTITYEIQFPDPGIDSTQMNVTETFSVASAFSLSTARQATHEAFKWVQFSSMYLDNTNHDGDSMLYVDSNEKIQYSKFSIGSGCNHPIFTSPMPLSSSHPWVELVHGDDVGVNGNTPNTIVLVNSPAPSLQITPQGYITCSSDPNDDNVGIWINHDSSPISFNVDYTDDIEFSLISQDYPREPPIPPLIFSDVPVEYWAWEYIERLARAGITGGCASMSYCPENTVTRAQMAVFLLKGIHGSSYAPPAVGASTGFNDVAIDYWAAAWIKQLAAEAITGGCGGGSYCPDNPVTRAQMAVFLLKAKHGSSYTPPAIGADSGFTDVAVNYWAAAWIKQLAAEGITSGCAAGLYCPENAVNRAQMAVFLVKTFNLP